MNRNRHGRVVRRRFSERTDGGVRQPVGCIQDMPLISRFYGENMKMDQETLIKIAEKLHREAFDANAYYQILQQYYKNRHDYADEMKISAAFYHTIHDALIKACFMEIAKLYDSSSGVISIGTLLTECMENEHFFPEYREMMTVEFDGTTFSYPIPYTHQLSPQEEVFFKERVESDRKLFSALNIPNAEKAPVQVDLTFPAFLTLYQKRFNALSKKRGKLRLQRNKWYAHNDEKCLLSNEDPRNLSAIYYPDIKEMIDFAFECTGLILGALTDTTYATKYDNIGDWTNTLMMVRIGLKYSNSDLQKE